MNGWFAVDQSFPADKLLLLLLHLFIYILVSQLPPAVDQSFLADMPLLPEGLVKIVNEDFLSGPPEMDENPVDAMVSSSAIEECCCCFFFLWPLPVLNGAVD